MNRRWLTIITITKDDAAGLARTIASAALLRAAGAEHLVVDGGGDADATKRVIEQTGGKVVIYPLAPRGITHAFNSGLGYARGEWVWFLNGGDQVDLRLKPEFLFALLEDSRAEVIIGGITYEGESELRPLPPRELQWPPFRSWIPHPSTLIRRRLFEQFGGFDERYSIAMDYEWWLRVLSASVPVDIVTVPFAVFAPGGVSQRPETQQKILREQADSLRKHFAVLWWPWLGFNARLLRAWLRAFVTRRLASRPPRS
jgi:GT2 family glycosyltransferase